MVNYEYLNFKWTPRQIPVLSVSRKLLTSSATHRWQAEIQEGIFNMLELFIDLVVTRLQHDPVPTQLLTILAMVRYVPRIVIFVKDFWYRLNQIYYWWAFTKSYTNATIYKATQTKKIKIYIKHAKLKWLEACSTNKSSCLAPASGVPQNTIVTLMIFGTLC